MPNDTDLAPVTVHGRELEAFHAPRPQIGVGHSGQQRDSMAGAHQLGDLGETGAAESKIRRQLRLFAALLKAFVELASSRYCDGALSQERRRILFLLRPGRRRKERVAYSTNRMKF